MRLWQIQTSPNSKSACVETLREGCYEEALPIHSPYSGLLDHILAGTFA